MSPMAISFLTKSGMDTSAVTAICNTFGVELETALAMCKAESGGNPDAIRYEKNYEWVYQLDNFAQDNGWTVDTERALQSMSWGVMQIMLATARQQGFRQHPKTLLEPNTGFAWGVSYFSHLRRKFPKGYDAISAYNQGHPKKNVLGRYRNQDYVDKVLEFRKGFLDGPAVL